MGYGVREHMKLQLTFDFLSIKESYFINNIKDYVICVLRNNFGQLGTKFNKELFLKLRKSS
ncbi:hypothetical protein C1143_18080 [Clostridium botulinum]|nr:hypothetical protein C1143_18080 [Clostridium botulinum]